MIRWLLSLFAPSNPAERAKRLISDMEDRK